MSTEVANVEGGTGRSFKTMFSAGLMVAAVQFSRYAGVGAATNVGAYLLQGNESRLTRLWLQRAESVQQVLRVPGGALAAALD